MGLHYRPSTGFRVWGSGPLLLGGSWDLVITYNWSSNPIYM